MQEEQYEIRLCVDCFHCKTKNGEVYCKNGVWKETNKDKSILHTPFDFNCIEWESA